MFEYRAASIIDLTIWPQKDIEKLTFLGQLLIDGREDVTELLSRIDELVANVLADDRLKPHSINEILLEVELNARRPKNKELLCLGLIITMMRFDSFTQHFNMLLMMCY
ncbi:hypothetical protein HA42_06320 [Pantoea deleyi]|nr:hypothetical protein HA42_06320 [Pantoea deleyi]